MFILKNPVDPVHSFRQNGRTNDQDRFSFRTGNVTQARGIGMQACGAIAISHNLRIVTLSAHVDDWSRAATFADTTKGREQTVFSDAKSGQKPFGQEISTTGDTGITGINNHRSPVFPVVQYFCPNVFGPDLAVLQNLKTNIAARVEAVFFAVPPLPHRRSKMKTKTTGLTMGLLLVLCITAFAGGVDGKWTGQAQGPQGPVDMTFVFKSDGEKLTGTLTNQFGEVAIHDGTIKGDAIAFKVTREFNGTKFTLKYTGNLAGDEIKLTRTFEGEGPGGQTPPPTDFTVKRVAN
ncbi:MAG: hypothetical protein SF339_22470 [Blastocatellia bacterium]|nr:hypothetical protein [Blastocatellia bacterium]